MNSCVGCGAEVPEGRHVCPECEEKAKQETRQEAKIPFTLPGCNEYIEACRRHYQIGARMKKETEEQIMWALKGRLRKRTRPVRIKYLWIEKDRRRDVDNVAFGKKFINDALVKLGVLIDDSQRWVVETQDKVTTGNKPGVVIIIEDI